MRLDFHISGKPDGQVFIEENLSEHQILPGGVLNIARSAAGYILSEEMLVNGFSISSHIIHLKKEAGVLFFAGKLSACLQGMLDGGFELPGNGGIISFHKNSYLLTAFLQERSYPVTIPPGRHHLFQVDYPVSLIEKLGITQMTLDAPAAVTVFFTQPLDLGKAAIKKIRQILQMAGVTPLPVIRLNNDCLAFLQIFLGQLEAREKAGEWDDGKTGRMGEVELFIRQNIGNTKLSQILDGHFTKRWKVTSYQFQRLVLKACGVSVSGLAHKRRMEGALEMLAGKKSISDVSNALGYGDVSSFSRAFRSFFGGPPSQYEHKN